MAKVEARRAGSTSHVWGYVIVLMAAMGFISCMYMLQLYFVPALYFMIFSKLLLLLPKTNRAAHSGPITFVSEPSNEGSSLLLAMERDVYYCYLVPLTIPVTIVACYANWVCLKFFRHN
ncbi:hypothetical protein PsorP6_010445 [Peronosclerospora sorghi]|uniref:Uncharacterized protein n=1 Tax=Peronosclerospora sorghi TaxID=230839 RepID=A0ACC0VVV9_9STRA|nr:hypothetical protein PsorP6_010445 [Peronosclerospora sorghi]